MKFSIFELGIFSFNSYVYYLTRGFIASTRALNLPTRAFNLPTRAFDLASRVFSLLTRGFELVTRGFELVTRAFELVTRNSCFTFPQKCRCYNLKGKAWVGELRKILLSPPLFYGPLHKDPKSIGLKMKG